MISEMNTALSGCYNNKRKAEHAGSSLNTAVMTSRRSELLVLPGQASEQRHSFTMHKLVSSHRQTNFTTTHLHGTNRRAGAGAHGTRVRVETSFPAFQFRHNGEIRTEHLVSPKPLVFN